MYSGGQWVDAWNNGNLLKTSTFKMVPGCVALNAGTTYNYSLSVNPDKTLLAKSEAQGGNTGFSSIVTDNKVVLAKYNLITVNFTVTDASNNELGQDGCYVHCALRNDNTSGWNDGNMIDPSTTYIQRRKNLALNTPYTLTVNTTAINYDTYLQIGIAADKYPGYIEILVTDITAN